jgi:hypothetical protein
MRRVLRTTCSADRTPSGRRAAVPDTEKKKPPYDPAVTSVAKATRESLPEGARAPGAKQVQAVIAAVGKESVADAAGISLAKLRRWAVDGERPEEYANLRGLAKAVEDPWAVSRRLAMVLVGLDEHRKAASK